MRISYTCAHTRNLDEICYRIRGSSAGNWCDVPLKLWPGEEDRDSKDPQQEQTAGVPQPGGVSKPSKTLVSRAFIGIDVA